MIAMMIWGQFKNKKGKIIKFFFPLILLYILLIPFYLIAVIVYFTFIFLEKEENEVFRYLKIFLNLPSIFHSMRGLEILVKNNDEDIKFIIK